MLISRNIAEIQSPDELFLPQRKVCGFWAFPLKRLMIVQSDRNFHSGFSTWSIFNVEEYFIKRCIICSVYIKKLCCKKQLVPKTDRARTTRKETSLKYNYRQGSYTQRQFQRLIKHKFSLTPADLQTQIRKKTKELMPKFNCFWYILCDLSI